MCSRTELRARRLGFTQCMSSSPVVRDLRAEVDGVRRGVEHAHVLAEALPAPGDPLGQRRARDVLDPLHQLDQALVLGLADRGEADAAVAHHAGGDPV